MAQPARPPVVDATHWSVASTKGNALVLGNVGDQSVVTAKGKSLLIVSNGKAEPDTRVRIQLRFPHPAAKGSLTFSSGLANPADLKVKGKDVTVAQGANAVTWSVHDPHAKTAQPKITGSYRPQFIVERSLAWPEALRANIEADMVASKPLADRWLTLDIVLRAQGYEASLDGIPLARVSGVPLDGFARITMTANVELAGIATTSVVPFDASWTHYPVPLDSVVNAATIDGHKIRRFAQAGPVTRTGVPFVLPEPDNAGHDHVNVGVSWFRQGNVVGRYSGRGTDAMAARWPGALIRDPARLTLRLPMARYRALHLLAAADSERDSVPVVTAQFYRAQAGFPKSFAARVPLFGAPASAANALPVTTTDGKAGRLYHITIPIDTSALAEFDDLTFVELELTKQVELYRASPDPLFYSQHAAGLPSSVHVYAVTAERAAVDVQLKADAYAHIWTAPETPRYQVTLRNRRGPARAVRVELATASLGAKPTILFQQSLQLPSDQEVTTAIPLKPGKFGLQHMQLTITDGDQVQVEKRDFAYLHEDTRTRGNWDFGRGPLFGFWNWGGGHHTPAADKQLLAMVKAGIEATPGSFEEYTKRHGDLARAVMEKYKVLTLKFAGAGDHYITAKFATELKTLGLDRARANFIKTLKDRQSAAGPNSRPLFLSFFPEPAIGPLTHGIFPKFIGEPETPFTDYEKERYQMFLNGFVEGAKIVREVFPEVKCLLPHGDPAFAIHFLQHNRAEVAKLLDGVAVDIPCFERLPEQQFHQVSLHRLYMTRKEMTDAGITKPYLPMYEGPCVPGGPGALTDQEHADLTIRNSLILLAYGIDIQNGGFPAFDTASYWGEQHYGFGVLNRVALETPKLAYTSLATLTRHLNRANYTKWIPTGSLNVFCLQFKHHQTGKLVHVLWTLRGTRPVTINVPAGDKLTVFDQGDNPLALANQGGKATFTIDQSPCYVEGLSADAQVILGEPNHGDAAPAAGAAKLANLGDGTWRINPRKEKEYEESHVPYIYRYPGTMSAQSATAPQAQGGKALAVHFEHPDKSRVFVPYYAVLKPAQPLTIPGKASHLGLWVKAAGDWGRVVYFLRDAKGEQWISVGTRGAWNCDDLHSWTSFAFDGWRYLRMELPAHSPYDLFRQAGNTWWGPYSAGDGIVDLPLTLDRIVIERRTHVMYVNTPEPADRSPVLLGDLYAEYAQPTDATPEAARLYALRMPIPTNVKGLDNPIAAFHAKGTATPIKIDRITLPNQEADGTQCFVHFPSVPQAKHYDIWVSAYEDGRGALQLGKAWKEPGRLIRGLRPDQDFYVFVVYAEADGKTSRPSAPFKIRLTNFFAMQ